METAIGRKSGFNSIFQFTTKVPYPFHFLKILGLPYTVYTDDSSPTLTPFTPPIRKLFFISFLFSFDDCAIERRICMQRTVSSFTKKKITFFHDFHYFTCMTKILYCKYVSKIWVSLDNSFFLTTQPVLLGFPLFYCRGYQRKINKSNSVF